MPQFSKLPWDECPPQYSDYFTKEFKPEKIKSCKRIFEYFHNDEHLKTFFHLGDKYKESKYPSATQYWKDFHARYNTYGFIQRLTCRFIEEYKSFRFSNKKYMKIYKKWENAVYLEQLPINIIVPILMLKFDFNYVNLSKTIAIAKMPEKFQLARNVKTAYTESAHETVIGSATHALVLKNWSIKNKNKENRDDILYEASSYEKAINEIEMFFAAIRINTGFNIGYYQVLTSPINWADNYTNDLPSVYLVAKKAYPTSFENYGWLKEIPILNRYNCKIIYKIFNQISNSKSPKINLALSRLNSAFLRTNESDTIIDISIALELLIGDNRSEITHKLSTRIATLSKISKFGNYTPSTVFQLCKKIYDYRSALVHGSKKVRTKREIKLSKENIIPTVDIGVELLRYTLLAICKNQDLLEDNKIDEILFK